MISNTNDDFLHSLFLLRSLLSSEFGKKNNPNDLNMQEYSLMHKLASNDNNTDLTVIREYLAVTKASVSQMLSSLEKRGMLIRQIDPANRRNLIVILTPEGKKQLQLKQIQVENRFDQLLEKLGEPDAKQFIHLINKMNNILSMEMEEN